MAEYKNILVGTNAPFIDWSIAIRSINKPNIVISNYSNKESTKNIILRKNIQYILPLSLLDYNLILKYTNADINNAKILHPSIDIYELLNNKNKFTEYMLSNFKHYIPDIYYLNNIQLNDICYPAVYKPMISSSGQYIKIIYNSEDLNNLESFNNIQQFIDEEYEYGAFLLCQDGEIIKQKIIRDKYSKYHIKNAPFKNTFEIVHDFDNSVFKEIVANLMYSGAMNIDFKIDHHTGRLYIFEINPRFGGSAFTNKFFYELICV